MRELYNTTLEIRNITKEKYDMLMDFLEDNNVSYYETDFKEFVIDERTEDEKYDDWLWEQADVMNDERRIENE